MFALHDRILSRSRRLSALWLAGLSAMMVALAPLSAMAQVTRLSGFALLPEVASPFTGFTTGGVSFRLDVPSSPTFFDEVLTEFTGVNANFRQGSRTLDVTGSALFFLAEYGGGLLFSTVAGEVLIDAGGPQLFTGPTSAPQFRSGVFVLDNFENAPAVLLVQRSFTIAAVPEPSTWLLLLAAGIAFPLGRPRVRRG